MAETHWPRVTGVIVRPRPLVEAGRPVAAAHVELRHPGDLLDLDPFERIDVAFLAAVGGDGVGQLASGVPSDRALLREQPGQVAEDRHALERVPARTGAEGVVVGTVGGLWAHPFRVGPDRRRPRLAWPGLRAMAGMMGRWSRPSSSPGPPARWVGG